MAGSLLPGRMRPPNATASPESLKMGNITRARNESCKRPRLLVNANPQSRNISASAPRSVASASHASGAQPSLNCRAMSPLSPRVRRYSRASLASGDVSNRWWYHSTACCMSSNNCLLRCRSRDGPPVVYVMVIPDLAARCSIAPTKSKRSTSCTNLKTSPDAPQPKHL